MFYSGELLCFVGCFIVSQWRRGGVKSSVEAGARLKYLADLVFAGRIYMRLRSLQ